MRHHALNKKDYISVIHRRWITQIMVLDKCPGHMGKNKIGALPHGLCQNESLNIQPKRYWRKIEMTISINLALKKHFEASQQSQRP